MIANGILDYMKGVRINMCANIKDILPHLKISLKYN